MTWQSFLNFSTMGHRHLVIVYVGVWAVQLSYVAWMTWRWTHTKVSRS